jgi:ubiquinone biosynthesis protein UbiJ
LKPAADALNHLLTQNSWAVEKLRPYAGRTVRIAVPPITATLCITNSGEFAPADADTTPDAEIGLTPGAALRALFQPEAAATLASIQGDAGLAAAVGSVLRDLRWDAEADLGRIIGDIPAHELSTAGRRIRESVTSQALSLAGMLSEFWLEEQPQIAKKRHIEQFAGEVDTLRDDIERLAKRLERLEAKR